MSLPHDPFGGPPKPEKPNPLTHRRKICGCCNNWALRSERGALVCVVCDLIPQKTPIRFRKPPATP